MNLSPIKTTPCFKSMPWGGTLLNEQYGKHSTFPVTGESWEAADHFNGKTPACGGAYDGMDFSQIIDAMGADAFLGRKTTSGHFPLLFKLIDAREKLSVQVHPNDEYAKRDGDLDMGALRQRYTPEELTGLLAHWAGLLPAPEPVRPRELIEEFDWEKVPKNDIYVTL